MRHRVKGRKLSRTASHRRATMRALAMALIKEHRIVTTLAKAKELRKFVEPVITRSKEDNQLNRKEVFSSLQNKEAVKTIFDVVGPKVGDRPGGYTRVIKTGFRAGDGAEMAVIELVDFNDIPAEGKTTKKKRTRRAGKSAKPSTTATPEAKEEVAKEEAPETSAETADEKVEEEEITSEEPEVDSSDSAEEEKK